MGDGGGQRSLVCGNPWGHKESDLATEQQPPRRKGTTVLKAMPSLGLFIL